MKKQSLSAVMAAKGMKLRTWAKSKGLSEKDIGLLNQLSYGFIQGKRGRGKELKEILESDGFKLHTK